MKSRHINSLQRMKAQLESGLKPEKINGLPSNRLTSMTEKDKQRLAYEIGALENRINGVIISYVLYKLKIIINRINIENIIFL